MRAVATNSFVNWVHSGVFVLVLSSIAIGDDREGSTAATEKKSDYLAFIPAKNFREYGYAIRPKAHAIHADGALRLVPSLSQSAKLESVAVSFPPGGKLPVETPEQIQKGTDILAGDVAYPVSMKNIAPWGVGLCALHVSMDNGESAILWIHISGRSPLTTVTGIGAVVLIGLALLFVLAVAMRDLSEAGQYVALIGPGAMLGLAAALLLQQYALAQFAWPPVMVLGLAGWGVAFVLHQVFKSVVEKSRAAAIRSQPMEAPKPEETPSFIGYDPATEEPRRFRPSFFQRIRLGLSGLGSGTSPPLIGLGLGPSIPSHVATAVAEAVMKIEVTLSCPPLVAADQEFTFTVRVPASIVTAQGAQAKSRELSIQLVAPGFSTSPGEKWRRKIEVGADPMQILGTAADYHLKPRPLTESTAAEVRNVHTVFMSTGEVLGAIEHPVGVVANAVLKTKYEQTPVEERGEELLAIANVHQDVLQQTPEGATTEAIEIPPRNQESADLTVWLQSSSSNGQTELSWIMETRDPTVRLQDGATPKPIGNSAKEFARALVNQVSRREGDPARETYMKGLGKQIGEAIPDEFWDALREVNRHSFSRPKVLILTEEPYVPWELALMPEPRLDSGVPGFLAAQAVVGRWLIGSGDMKWTAADVIRNGSQPSGTTAGSAKGGRAKYKKSIPLMTRVENPVFITGTYSQMTRLEHAEKEAQELHKTFGGQIVNASFKEVMNCLEHHCGDLLHFACHGKYDPLGYEDGLAMIDNLILTPNHVAGLELPSPFVFLNACQIGTGSEVLGTHGGMVRAFFAAGAAAVVAPLWSVRDTISSEIADRFYREVVAGESPAEILRRVRCEFHKDEQDGSEPSPTLLAYLFFGHPNYKLMLTNLASKFPPTKLHVPVVGKKPGEGQSRLKGLSPLTTDSAPPNVYPDK
jgi:hypothetical protein